MPATSCASRVNIATVRVGSALIPPLITTLSDLAIYASNSSATCNGSRRENMKIGKLAPWGLRWYVIAHAARDGKRTQGDHRRGAAWAA